VEEVEDENESP